MQYFAFCHALYRFKHGHVAFDDFITALAQDQLTILDDSRNDEGSLWLPSFYLDSGQRSESELFFRGDIAKGGNHRLEQDLLAPLVCIDPGN